MAKKVKTSVVLRPAQPTTLQAIRHAYVEKGVEGFYATTDHYDNPHLAQIAQLLTQNQHRIDFSRVLDFACGSGEVTQILADMGHTQTVGCDPFLGHLFEKKHQKTCLNLDFEAVIRGALQPLVTAPFSAIVCSFAMHLCPEKQLFPLVQQLFQHSRQLVIISPHKRPDLSLHTAALLQFEDSVLTDKGKKVFLKAYAPPQYGAFF